MVDTQAYIGGDRDIQDRGDFLGDILHDLVRYQNSLAADTSHDMDESFLGDGFLDDPDDGYTQLTRLAFGLRWPRLWSVVIDDDVYNTVPKASTTGPAEPKPLLYHTLLKDENASRYDSTTLAHPIRTFIETAFDKGGEHVQEFHEEGFSLRSKRATFLHDSLFAFHFEIKKPKAFQKYFFEESARWIWGLVKSYQSFHQVLKEEFGHDSANVVQVQVQFPQFFSEILRQLFNQYVAHLNELRWSTYRNLREQFGGSAKGSLRAYHELTSSLRQLVDRGISFFGDHARVLVEQMDSMGDEPMASLAYEVEELVRHLTPIRDALDIWENNFQQGIVCEGINGSALDFLVLIPPEAQLTSLIESLQSHQLALAKKEGVRLELKIPHEFQKMHFKNHNDMRAFFHALAHWVSNGIIFRRTVKSGGQMLLDQADHPWAVFKPWVRLEMKSTFDDQVLITIEDNGRGMSADFVSDTYGCYQKRAPEVVEEGIPGSGRGVAIASALIKKLGGTMRVESLLNYGTKIFVWLPLHLFEEQEHPKGSNDDIDSQRYQALLTRRAPSRTRILSVRKPDGFPGTDSLVAWRGSHQVGDASSIIDSAHAGSLIHGQSNPYTVPSPRVGDLQSKVLAFDEKQEVSPPVVYGNLALDVDNLSQDMREMGRKASHQTSQTIPLSQVYSSLRRVAGVGITRFIRGRHIPINQKAQTAILKAARRGRRLSATQIAKLLNRPRLARFSAPSSVAGKGVTHGMQVFAGIRAPAAMNMSRSLVMMGL